MKGSRGLVLLLVALVVAGGARADEVRADDLLLDGPILLPDGGRLEGVPLALYLNATERVRSFTAEFPRVHVTLYERQMLVARDLVSVEHLPLDIRSWTVHDVRVDLAAGDATGFIGLYPGKDAALALDLEPGAAVSAVGLRHYGDSATGTGGDRPDHDYYSRSVDHAHVSAIDPGVLTLSGGGALKVNGLDLLVRSRENTSTLTTGEEDRQAAPGAPGGTARVERWVVFTYAVGTIRVDSASEHELALADAKASWSGRATLRPGEDALLRLEGEEFGGGSAVSLVGDFTADLDVDEAGGSPALRVDLRGEGVTAADASVRPQERAWLPLLLVGLPVLVTAGAVGYVLHRRRRAMDLDEMVTLAHLAGEGGRHEEALGWIRKARALAPTSGLLALEEAFHLGELGLVDEALSVYREAGGLLDDGQPEFDAAMLALRAGALPPAGVERLLVAALDKNPGLVLELEDADAAHPPLPVGAALAAAVARARQRLDGP